ncbi:helix-turn-helix transcriptional regulator [Entomohabitans teleogrylli]|uniref:helix-turn-helix transcriptional regulator n=1 Tax=Entomohabitans teleogrylli TaxID=1384589 RepID=UPI00073D651B|nr:helix-turn-helix transcriptional regulator [Entomohabitans teleogrylli]
MNTCTAPIPPGAFIFSCLENITRLIPGAIGAWYLVDDELTPRQHILSGIDKMTHQLYLHHFLALDPLHPRHFNHQLASFACLDNAVQETAYYRQFMRPNHMADMIEIFVRRHKRIVAALSLMRDRPFNAREKMRLRAVLPLVEVATGEVLPCETPHHLTPKEQEIVEMIREGACNKRIASQLDISLSTVKTHLRNIFSKTHASNRTELLRNVSTAWYERQAG